MAKKKTKKAKRKPAKPKIKKFEKTEGKKLGDYCLEIINKAPARGITALGIIEKMAKLGLRVVPQAVGKALSAKAEVIRDGDAFRLASGPERAARTDKINLTLANAAAVRRARPPGGNGDPGERGPHKKRKPNLIAGIEVLDCVLDGKDLDPKSKHRLLLTVRRLLTGEG